MGRGPRTSETNVRKKPQEYTRGLLTAGEGASAKTADECLFTVEAAVTAPASEASGIQKSSPVFIVPHHTDTERLELFIENRSFGAYNRPDAQKMLTCIQKGYIYEGAVKSVSKVADGIEIVYALQGRGR